MAARGQASCYEVYQKVQPNYKAYAGEGAAVGTLLGLGAIPACNLVSTAKFCNATTTGRGVANMGMAMAGGSIVGFLYASGAYLVDRKTTPFRAMDKVLFEVRYGEDEDSYEDKTENLKAFVNEVQKAAEKIKIAEPTANEVKAIIVEADANDLNVFCPTTIIPEDPVYQTPSRTTQAVFTRKAVVLYVLAKLMNH